ncbi:MAG: hypothetical protein E7530_00770 [Ruminococcaceae bacterium]|nr:hypothetical protein [Oscillospiraceae bacterium]
MKNKRWIKIVLLIIGVILVSETARGALVLVEAKDIIDSYSRYSEDATELYENLNDRYTSENIVKAFYLSHENLKIYQLDPLSMDMGFYSTVENKKGEIVAFSQPYILFEKNPDKDNSDIRILPLGDEFTQEYSDLGYYSKRDGYIRRAVRSLENTTGYGKGDFDRVNTTVYVNGTCDSDYVYLEKLEWYDNEKLATYTFTPSENNTEKGSVDFNKWFGIKGDVANNYRLDISSVSAVEYADTALNNEAKAVCEKKMLENGTAISETDGCLVDEGLITSTVYLTKTLADGDDNPENDYVFSCAYVFHPMRIAAEKLSYTFLGYGIGIARTIAIIVGIIFINKKAKKA